MRGSMTDLLGDHGGDSVPGGSVARLVDRLALRWSAMRARIQAKPDPEEYRLLVRSLFSSPASIIQAGLLSIATPALCWLGSRHQGFLIITGLMVLIFALRMVTFVRFPLGRPWHDLDASPALLGP